jgi:TatD DNase family protein
MARGQARFDRPREAELPPAPEPLVAPVLDSHCHLDIMGGDPAAILAAARAVGVVRVVTVGIDVASSQWCADAAASYDDVDATVAIHPNEAPRTDDDAFDDIARLAALPHVRAVGETGLDHFRTPEDQWRRQEESFRRHIAIAKETGKALVIHDRDAHDDVLRVLDEEGAPARTVFHCFSGDAVMARTCADKGYVMSFAGNVTFKNADDLRAAARVAPQDQLLVETDAPFLTPMPHRGKANAPYLIPFTLRALAAIRSDDVDELCAAVSVTGEHVFG